jgi:tetrahydromethanopterin S-methyltransferase subunit G
MSESEINAVNARLDQIEHMIHMFKVRQNKIEKRLEEIERQQAELLNRITRVPASPKGKGKQALTAD